MRVSHPVFSGLFLQHLCLAPFSIYYHFITWLPVTLGSPSHSTSPPRRSFKGRDVAPLRRFSDVLTLRFYSTAGQLYITWTRTLTHTRTDEWRPHNVCRKCRKCDWFALCCKTNLMFNIFFLSRKPPWCTFTRRTHLTYSLWLKTALFYA